ncbi:unnamed protein product, partial [marine sediment metagenome]
RLRISEAGELYCKDKVYKVADCSDDDNQELDI